MHHLPPPTNPRPYTRTPLLLMAYGALGAAILNLIVGSGMLWIAGSAGLAVVLGLIEIVVQVRRRSADDERV
jgi:hypothetical protein